MLIKECERATRGCKKLSDEPGNGENRDMSTEVSRIDNLHTLPKASHRKQPLVHTQGSRAAGQYTLGHLIRSKVLKSLNVHR